MDTEPTQQPEKNSKPSSLMRANGGVLWTMIRRVLQKAYSREEFDKRAQEDLTCWWDDEQPNNHRS